MKESGVMYVSEGELRIVSVWEWKGAGIVSV
jgi:hypothetical protein